MSNAFVGWFISGISLRRNWSHPFLVLAARDEQYAILCEMVSFDCFRLDTGIEWERCTRGRDGWMDKW